MQDFTNRKSFPGKLFLMRTSGSTTVDGCLGLAVALDSGRHRRRLRVICDDGGGEELLGFGLRLLLLVGRSDFPCDTVRTEVMTKAATFLSFTYLLIIVASLKIHLSERVGTASGDRKVEHWSNVEILSNTSATNFEWVNFLLLNL